MKIPEPKVCTAIKSNGDLDLCERARKAAMQRAMLEHRYDVQAALYLLALHRLLKARLGPAYDPRRQLGGAIYLFLRGVNGPAAGCCPVTAPLGLIEDLDALLQSCHASSSQGAA